MISDHFTVTDPKNHVSWGCNPRDSGVFGKECGDGDLDTMEDLALDIIPRSEWIEEGVGMSECVFHIFDQLDGMCASNAITAGMMACLKQQTGEEVFLAPEDLYDHVGRWGTGSTIPENVNAAANIGIRTRRQVAHDWPVKRPDGWQGDAAEHMLFEWADFSNHGWDGMVSLLHRDFCCFFGIIWPGGGAHAILATEYGNKLVRGPNSWGSDWGEDGFFKLSERQCKTLPRFGGVGIRAVTIPSYLPQPKLVASRGCPVS